MPRHRAIPPKYIDTVIARQIDLRMRGLGDKMHKHADALRDDIESDRLGMLSPDEVLGVTHIILGDLHRLTKDVEQLQAWTVSAIRSSAVAA